MAALPIIETIKHKLDKIISENKRLLSEVSKLQGSNNKLKGQNQDLKAKLELARKRISLLELRDGFEAGGADKNQAQIRVKQLMREIDKCITIVNGQVK